jgi:hypothetical protein
VGGTHARNTVTNANASRRARDRSGFIIHSMTGMRGISGLLSQARSGCAQVGEGGER